MAGHLQQEFAATMPETAQGFLDAPIMASSIQGAQDGASTSSASPTADAPPERKTVKVSKNILTDAVTVVFNLKKAVNRFKKHAAEFPIACDVEHNHPDKEASKNRMPDVASVGKGRSARHFLRIGWRSAGHSAAMGPASARTRDEGGNFFPEENPEDTAVLVKEFLAN